MLDFDDGRRGFNDDSDNNSDFDNLDLYDPDIDDPDLDNNSDLLYEQMNRSVIYDAWMVQLDRMFAADQGQEFVQLLIVFSIICILCYLDKRVCEHLFEDCPWCKDDVEWVR